MIAPSLERAFKVVGSRYALVIASVKRAKEIREQKDPFSPKIDDPLGQAFEEIASKKIKVILEE